MDKFLGKRLDGRYEIQEIVGVGGMAVVYKAYDNVENKIVAVKILKEEYTGNDEFLRRFKNESKAIAVLSHPNVVKVSDVSFGDLIQYIVMEYIVGITLKEYIEQSGPLSWNDAVHFTLQILRGLQHAHDRGVVHRDIKPQNIMVLPDGVIKVADFGIARFARSDQETITDKAIGSVHYISPEQAKGEKTDEKADVYSVGVMLYEMLTGKLPFQAESAVSVAIMQLQKDPTLPRDINGSIPLGLEQITMHAMQKDTLRRYKSAAEMLCDLEAFKKNPAISFDYDYFVDDSPTRYIPDTNDEEEKQEQEQPAKKEKKIPIIPILIGITATFVVALVIILIWAWNVFNLRGDEVQVPNFVGLAYEDVVGNKEYEGVFIFTLEPGEHDQNYPEGTICKQTPDEGTDVKKGTKISLTVSLGEKEITVPNVYGQNIEKAKSNISKAGFEFEIETRPDEDIALDHVIETNPRAGKSVSPETKITIIVSAGPPAEPVSLGDYLGLHEEDIVKELSSDMLKLGEKTYAYSDKYDKGYICGMSPDPTQTAEVEKGTAVDIVISKGKYPSVDFSVEMQKYQDVEEATVVLYHHGKEYYNTNTLISFADNNTVSFNFEKVKISADETNFEIYYYYDSPENTLVKTKVDEITVKINTNTSTINSNDDEVVVL